MEGRLTFSTNIMETMTYTYGKKMKLQAIKKLLEMDHKPKCKT